MAGPSTRAPSPSLSESYLESIRSFGNFLLALSEESCRVIHLEHVDLSEMLEEYGRTKIWGDQTKADLPERARGSLDDRLRHDDELKCLVQAILARLRILLDQATYIARRKYDPGAGSDHDSISSVSADSDSDSDDNREHQHDRRPKICLLTQQISGQIRSLYDLSALLRRPKIADKYIRSVNSKSNTTTQSDRDTLPLSVGFSSADENHIVEKVLQWRGLTKSERCIKFEDEEVAPIERVTNDCVEDISWFCQRLAGANTRRREQLQYWSSFPYDPKQDAAKVGIPAIPNRAQVHAEQVEGKQKSQGQTYTDKLPEAHASHEKPVSAVSKQSFSTAAVSDIHDTKTNVRPRTVYAPTAFGQGRANFVPDPPKVENGNITFPCPYCGTILEYSEMQNRQSWKRHVFHDLRPYVCTFEDCQNAGKLYVSRHDWIYHELQLHRREYVCKVCHMTCRNRKEMSTHLREHYGESISPAYLGVILDLCNHQLDVQSDKNDQCLICGEELSLSALQGHLAAHMEDIALFVLPHASEEDETGDSKASVQVPNLKSEGKRSGTESKLSSLGFSAAGDFGQTPADFAKLLTSEEVGYTSKLSSWRTRDEDQWASIKATVARLKDLDGDVRRSAVQALGGQLMLPDEILIAVAARLEDVNRDVRCAALQALSGQTTLPDEMLKAMAARFEDPIGAVRHAAVQALGNQSVLPDGILKAVAARLEDSDKDVRRAAVQALRGQTTLPDEILKAVVVARLKDPDRDVRRAEVQALGGQSDLSDEVLNALAAKVEDSDEEVRCAAVQALVGRSAFPEDMLKIRPDYLNILISLLGKQKDYKTLVGLLSGLWANRHVQRTWSSTMTLSLGRCYILALYLVGDGSKAVRLAEDLVYNCRRVNGVRNNSTLDMSTLLSQLYTGMAQRYQSHKNGQELANRYYKRSANLHENQLRDLVDPSFAEFEAGPDNILSIDDHDYDRDISSNKSKPVGEHVRQHLQLLKLAVQRLGDWPKAYVEYERLNADLFLRFGPELQDVEGIEKWDLKAFGSGKAASDEDILELEFKTWELDITQEVEELL